MNDDVRGPDDVLARMERIAVCLRTQCPRCSTEAAFQGDIAAALTTGGLVHAREVVLTARDRVDFMCNRIGLEAKVGGSLADALRQLSRYADSDRVDGLLLLTSRLLLTRVPDTLCGKPVRAVYLGGML